MIMMYAKIRKMEAMIGSGVILKFEYYTYSAIIMIPIQMNLQKSFMLKQPCYKRIIIIFNFILNTRINLFETIISLRFCVFICFVINQL